MARLTYHTETEIRQAAYAAIDKTDQRVRYRRDRWRDMRVGNRGSHPVIQMEGKRYELDKVVSLVYQIPADATGKHVIRRAVHEIMTVLRDEHRRAKPKYWWRPDVCVNQHTKEGPWCLQLWTVFAFPIADHDSYTPLNARICPHCGGELPEVHNG